MRIIISPAKKMNTDNHIFAIEGMPNFLDESRILMQHIQQLSYTEMKRLWKCNDQLAQLNFDRFHNMNLETGLTPAIFSYEGLQYQYMAPGIFTQEALVYLSSHLRILSGFYGVLLPFDGVKPYRLEMGTKMPISEYKDLYAFWGDKIYREVLSEDHIIINLASKEYAQSVEKYLSAEDRLITIEFGENIDGKVKQKGTFAKMARGEMVRFMAENQITDVEKIKDFNGLNLKYCDRLSNHRKFVFVH